MKKNLINIIIPIYILLGVLMALSAGSIGFLILPFLFTSLVYLISLRVKSSLKFDFFFCVIFFLCFYTTFATIAHLVVIENPSTDGFVNIDEIYFIKHAQRLASNSKGYLDIWKTAFTEFQYSSSQLYHAINATLIKATGLNSYWAELLIRWKNAFIGSFIPGIIYLLGVEVTERKRSLKAAIVYGLLSFTFFYAVGLMRDLPIALVYAVGLYIIMTKNCNFKNIILLLFLGVIATFLRYQNGLFLLAFIGVFILNRYRKNKLFVLLFSLFLLIAAVVFVGVFHSILNSATGTIENYSARVIDRSEGGLSITLRKLPMPLNYIALTIYGQIVLFPFWAAFNGKGIGNIFFTPFALAALFWFAVWVRLLRSFKYTKLFFQKYKYESLLALLFIVMVSAGQTLSRRLMPVYPVIYLAYVYVSGYRKGSKTKEILIDAAIYLGLLLLYFLIKI